MPVPLIIHAAQSIPTKIAHLLVASFAFSYVGSLYIFKNGRLSFASKAKPTRNGEARRKRWNERWRDDPDVIKARLASVILATLVCCIGVSAVLWHSVYHGNVTLGILLWESLRRLGFDLNANTRPILPHLVAPVLFLGPLYARYLQESLPFQRWWSIKASILPVIFTWQGLRNYVFGPITEEIVFRGCILSIYHLATVSMKRMIFLSPLSFGAAHIHHAWDTFNRYGRTPAAFRRAILMMLFQLTYTTIFGSYCAFLFLRTSSIFPPITAHIFCNIMGVPQIGYELSQFPQRRAAIILAYGIGIISFMYVLWPWTEVEHGMYWPPEVYYIRAGQRLAFP